LSILPAPAAADCVFRRTDLEGKPELEARIENVSVTNRSTTLAKGNVKIHTVEHVLAALAGLGVDNAIIELDANEPPIADGSSREFTRRHPRGGHQGTAGKKRIHHPGEPIELRTGDAMMTVFPDEHFKITCTSTDKKKPVHAVFFHRDHAQDVGKELSHARTFVFF